jgi:hypothetical protein
LQSVKFSEVGGGLGTQRRERGGIRQGSAFARLGLRAGSSKLR